MNYFKAAQAKYGNNIDVDIDLLARYREAAIKKYDYNDDFEIEDDAHVSLGANANGAWVTGRIWIWKDELEPMPGPTYCVYISNYDDKLDQWGAWILDQTFTCDDDDDGRKARRNAHEYARYLRKTFHCSYAAVRPADAMAPHRRPLSVQALADYDFKDFSASQLGL